MADRADHARAGVVVEPAAAGLHDALARRQQGLGRGIAERHQHVRIDQLDLALDERQADLRLLRRRRAVAGRPPRNDIGDVGACCDRARSPPIMRSSSLPERPTNGRPSMSSSRPGASPTNMMRACGLPSENTRRVAVDFSAQPSKFSSSARSASSVGAVRAASRADCDRRLRRRRRLAASGSRETSRQPS